MSSALVAPAHMNPPNSAPGNNPPSWAGNAVNNVLNTIGWRKPAPGGQGLGGFSMRRAAGLGTLASLFAGVGELGDQQDSRAGNFVDMLGQTGGSLLGGAIPLLVRARGPVGLGAMAASALLGAAGGAAGKALTRTLSDAIGLTSSSELDRELNDRLKAANAQAVAAARARETLLPVYMAEKEAEIALQRQLEQSQAQLASRRELEQSILAMALQSAPRSDAFVAQATTPMFQFR